MLSDAGGKRHFFLVLAILPGILLAVQSGIDCKAQPPGILGTAAAAKDQRLRPKRLYLLQLMMAPKIQQEITLEKDQEAAFEKMRAQLGERIKKHQQSAYESNREKDPKKREALRSKSAEQFQAVFEEGDEKLEEILFPSQMDRLKGIFLQQLGARALFQDWVVDELEISDSQSDKLQKVLDESSQSIKDEVSKLAEQNEHGRIREVIVKRNEEMGKDLLAILTKTQQNSLERLKGEAFELR
ncbi:hypothetical protein K227x_07600 [Rubripirellula lacrimiformis]|uniref:LTXXQ motif protein n=1 Tax=Rubripirellula lacrimiformis TaxID=1930273 RepID=A0A517N5H6_9BACT|nr:hypothetical protein [Rubripirellula lacrimiformis]QDT02384.1 hypothetical protein K227x_07600 [Rubripirellula lacrimiformis]